MCDELEELIVINMILCSFSHPLQETASELGCSSGGWVKIPCHVVYNSCAQWYAYVCSSYSCICQFSFRFWFCVFSVNVGCVFSVFLVLAEAHFVFLDFFCIWFCFFGTSEEIGWEDCLQIPSFGWVTCKTLTQSINCCAAWTMVDHLASSSSCCLVTCSTRTTACLNIPPMIHTLSRSAPSQCLLKMPTNGELIWVI